MHAAAVGSTPRRSAWAIAAFRPANWASGIANEPNGATETPPHEVRTAAIRLVPLESDEREASGARGGDPSVERADQRRVVRRGGFQCEVTAGTAIALVHRQGRPRGVRDHVERGGRADAAGEEEEDLERDGARTEPEYVPAAARRTRRLPEGPRRGERIDDDDVARRRVRHEPVPGDIAASQRCLDVPGTEHVLRSTHHGEPLPLPRRLRHCSRPPPDERRGGRTIPAASRRTAARRVRRSPRSPRAGQRPGTASGDDGRSFCGKC